MQTCESVRVARVMRLLDAAFGHPRGPLGRFGAALMVAATSRRRRGQSSMPDCMPDCGCLVVGHGPGVGLVQAAVAVTPGGQVTGVDPSPLMA